MLDEPQRHVLCALDTDNFDQAFKLAQELVGSVGGIKLGKEFFSANGPEGVRRIAAIGLPIFLDLKFHDIPNTVARAVKTITRLQPFMMNVHALGGEFMMREAKRAADEMAADLNIKPPLVVAVTILTHFDQASYERLSPRKTSTFIADHAKHLAALAQGCGLDGVVCSAKEIEVIRSECGPEFKLVVPGLRPPWVRDDDQRRVMSPDEAWKMGADYLVIGRPITANHEHPPREAADRIVRDLLAVHDNRPNRTYA